MRTLYKIGLLLGFAGMVLGFALLLTGCATPRKHCPVAVIEVRECNGGYVKGLPARR